MKFKSTTRGTTYVPIFLALLSTAAIAQERGFDTSASAAAATTTHTSEGWAAAPTAVRDAVGASRDTFTDVLFDEPGDGALWARGAAYKARFDGSGATIIPFFGSDAPRNFPVKMSGASASIGGVALASGPDAEAILGDHAANSSRGRHTTKASRAGRTVSIDHGSFVETYELGLESLEQRFVFETLPSEGDLVVWTNVESELSGSDLGTRLRFENELGRVDYGEAFAIDASGRRIALDSTLVDGVLKLVVPADFVATADLPLTIDPFVTFFTVASSPLYEYFPDVSYDVTSDRWCVVWMDVYSATDYDSHARLITGTGTLLGTVIIDFTTDTWTHPKIANNRQNGEFLVVAAVTPVGGVSGIAGRFLFPGPGTTGAPFSISPADGGYRDHPDIGGDENTGGFATGNFAVVWQRPVSASAVTIEMRIVSAAGALAPVIPLDNSNQLNENPRISKGLGLAAIAQPSWIWTIVWQRKVSTSNHDIYGAQVQFSGAVLHSAFPVNTSTNDDTFPVVSRIMDPLPTFTERPYLVAYQRDFGDHDIVASVFIGNGLYLETNLVGGFDAGDWYKDQTFPSVDCDGTHFLVGHVEKDLFPSNDTNVFVSDYYLSGNNLTASQVHGNFAGSPQTEEEVAVCSMAASGGPKQHFFGTWMYASANNLTDIQGGLWDTGLGGNVQGFCSSENPNTLCPCGNAGTTGHGCATFANSSGALLVGIGSAAISNDTLMLQGSGMLPNSPCLYFQGTSTIASGSGIVFGDGVLCVGGTVIRMGVKANDATGSSSFNGAPSNISQRGGLPTIGGSRYYQVWYRDSSLFCTSATFNLTNGVQVDWAW